MFQAVLGAGMWADCQQRLEPDAQEQPFGSEEFTYEHVMITYMLAVGTI